MLTDMILRGLVIAASAVLWRVGGASGYSKGFRRFGCPGVIFLFCIYVQNWLALASFPLLALAFSLGYGESSTLTCFWKNIVEKSRAKYLTRMTCGLAYSAAALFVMWNNWWGYGFHIVFVTAFVTLNGNQKFKRMAELEEWGMGLIVAFMPVFVL